MIIEAIHPKLFSSAIIIHSKTMILIKLQNEKKGQSNEDVKQANGRVSVF